MVKCDICESEEHLTGKCKEYSEWIKKPYPEKEKECKHPNMKEIHTSDVSESDSIFCCIVNRCEDCDHVELKEVSIGCNKHESRNLK